jgi:molybdenum cofactor biosynthesis enzyme MoaA
MKLEDIGFYTLSDERAKSSSEFSPLQRCELILTDRCNFKCPYCRGLFNKPDLSLRQARNILQFWMSEGLKNIRFSGGEPTLYPGLDSLVKLAKMGNTNRIAISTNGSASIDLYKHLIDCGVNDFSISLDACCSSTGDMMSGKKGIWNNVIKNIKELSSLVYTTVGIVFNEDNEKEITDIIYFAHELGVSDIRVIPSAQYNKRMNLNISQYILDVHPILKYRLTNNKHVRGMNSQDSQYCKLVLDDMAVYDNEHYPCIIYLREHGNAIGEMTGDIRKDRAKWHNNHNIFQDPICKNNCLDVCVAYNNKARDLKP